MSIVSTPMTAEELERFAGEDAVARELERGELIEMSPAGPVHGEVCMAVAGPLWMFIKSRGLGKTYGAETGFLVEEHPDTVLAPDFAFICKARIASLNSERGFIKGAPDIVVEVMSPSDSVKSAAEKADKWLRYGARQCWIVNLKRRTVTIQETNNETRELFETETIDKIELLPDFRLAVRDLFECLDKTE
jgi:Uma2 family endonuclease